VTDRPRGPRPGVALVLGSVSSVQFGAALAATAFRAVGPLGIVTLRLVVAAVVLAAAYHSRLRLARRDLAVCGLFGLVTATMNVSIYLAFARLPLGPTVTLEFLGPLALALGSSRRWVDAGWAALAGAGVILLGHGLHHLDPVGVGLALLAGAAWAGYIVLTARVGGRVEGGAGLAVAQAIGALAVLPIGILAAGSALLRPHVLAVGLAVGILSSVLPYRFDLAALRRLPRGTFGVLMSLNPSVAALAGWAVLGQHLAGESWAAIGLVVVASAGVTRRAFAASGAGPGDRPRRRVERSGRLGGLFGDRVGRVGDGGGGPGR
jgi:inner membrane transporter RhtA